MQMSKILVGIMCICECVCIRVHVHLRNYACTCVPLHSFVHGSYMCMCICVHVCLCVCIRVYRCLWLSSVARWSCSRCPHPPLLFIFCPGAMFSPEDLTVLCSGLLSLWAHFPCTHRYLSFPFLTGQWVRWELIAFWPWLRKGDAGVLCRSSLAAGACVFFN